MWVPCGVELCVPPEPPLSVTDGARFLRMCFSECLSCSCLPKVHGRLSVLGAYVVSGNGCEHYEPGCVYEAVTVVVDGAVYICRVVNP